MKRHACRRDLPDPQVFIEPDSPLDDELFAIVAELQRVRTKFGVQSLTLFDWACILGEEYGEVCRAINEEHFDAGQLSEVYKECIQVASVAVHIAAAIRCSDNQRGE